MLRASELNKRRLSASKQLTLGAMVAALTLLSLYAAAVLPAGKFAAYFFSSVFIYVLTCEVAYATAVIAYLASSALALLMLPDKLPAFVYIVLLGHYGIFRTAVNTRMKKGLFRVLLKLLYCDFFASAGLYLSRLVLGLPIAIAQQYPAWLIVLLAQAGFIVYDVLFGLTAAIYETRLRRAIVPRR